MPRRKWSMPLYVARTLWKEVRDADDPTEKILEFMEQLPPRFRRKVLKYLTEEIKQAREIAEVVLQGISPLSTEKCPGCGRMPGEPLTARHASCTHPLGCGFWSLQN